MGCNPFPCNPITSLLTVDTAQPPPETVNNTRVIPPVLSRLLKSDLRQGGEGGTEGPGFAWDARAESIRPGQAALTGGVAQPIRRRRRDVHGDNATAMGWQYVAKSSEPPSTVAQEHQQLHGLLDLDSLLAVFLLTHGYCSNKIFPKS